ncbi:putative duf159 domain protein [Rosellinia necatrix]|uniref:Putative duf159 domain protein n=1 Tax=Rosellinia necatrix TaxID=77044 RepID=A0A1S7UMQ5_ROSNE|nr:putative duf159 domain protein [Rosellinia necatrix]
MCGRYALALRPSQIRQMLRDDNMPIYEAPNDPEDDRDEDDGGGGGGEAYNGPRQSYNFAPGYSGVVYRADVPDWGAGPRPRHDGDASTGAINAPSHDSHIDTQEQNKETDEQQPLTDTDHAHYKLQAMKWGLVPFWTKRNPGYGSMMKTINCRDDSLAQGGGMWSSMKSRKRCVVIAQGFYEWLKKNDGREKLPHYVKRKDGKLMCMAGLWDVVQYENNGEKQYTYTIITTDSNKQLNFLHDRMPVILDNGSENMRKWLDPERYEWSKELQSLLMPYNGELEVYPVSKDVGKVGNNSPAFIIPVDSKENKSNIANFFAKSMAKKEAKKVEIDTDDDPIIKIEQHEIEITGDVGFIPEDINGKDRKADVPVGVKREAGEEPMGQRSPKKLLSSTTLYKTPDIKGGKESSPRKGDVRRKISATSNGNAKGAAKTPKSAGTQKITRFFTNSS